MKCLHALRFALLVSVPACMDVERVLVSNATDGAAFDRKACVECMSEDSDPATSCADVVKECNKFTTCGGTLACTLKSCVGGSFADFIACVNVCVRDNGLVG